MRISYVADEQTMAMSYLEVQQAFEVVLSHIDEAKKRIMESICRGNKIMEGVIKLRLDYKEIESKGLNVTYWVFIEDYGETSEHYLGTLRCNEKRFLFEYSDYFAALSKIKKSNRKPKKSRVNGGN